MRIRVQVVIEAEDDVPPAVHQVANLQRGDLGAATLGLQLAEAKLLARVQEVVVEEQVRSCRATRVACPHCRRPRRHKDARTIAVRSLFGTLRLPSPRWHHCPCRPNEWQTFSPLTEVLPERTTPELLYLEAKFAGPGVLRSQRQAAGRPPPARTSTASHLGPPPRPGHGAHRLEEELGPEQAMFIEGCQRDWEELPRPDLPLTVGLDGGYVHASEQRSRREGWFEVIAGKSMPAEGEPKCFGYVQTYDTKPKRRLFELLRAQGMQMNQQVT
jgi:hypothetical protein